MLRGVCLSVLLGTLVAATADADSDLKSKSALMWLG